MKTNTPVSPVRKKSARRITGQGMTEYIIVLALVALAAVVAVGFFGDTVKAQFGVMSNKLAGEAATTSKAAVKTGSDGAEGAAGAAGSLKTYGD